MPKIHYVCQPADAPLTIPGTTFDKTCSLCGRRVMTSPGGRKFLAEHSEDEVSIECGPCAATAIREQISQGADIQSMLPGTVEEVLSELQSAIPNTWRNRN